MKALVLRGKTLSIDEVPIPVINDNEVLVNVKYAGICKTDLRIIDGSITANTKICGHEFSGIVASVGKNVDRTICKFGDYVTANPMICGNDSETDCMLGKDVDGCYAEYVKVPVHAIAKLDREIHQAVGSFIEPIAAALGAYESVYSAWLNSGKLVARDAFSVGLFGYGRMVDLLKYAIEYHGFKTTIIDETIPRNSFDCVVESDPTRLNLAMEYLKTNGTLVLKSRYFKSVNFDINAAVMRNLTLVGNRYSNFSDAAIFAKLNNEVMLERLQIVDFEKFEDAFASANNASSKKIIFKLPELQ